MTYPPPANLTGLADLFIYVNDVTGQMFSLLMVFLMFLIPFIASKLGGQTTQKSLILSFFLALSISIYFWAAGFILGKIVVILIVLLVLSIIYEYISQR